MNKLIFLSGLLIFSNSSLAKTKNDKIAAVLPIIYALLLEDEQPQEILEERPDLVECRTTTYTPDYTDSNPERISRLPVTECKRSIPNE